MAKRNPYVVMRTVRTTTTAEPIYEGPMTYAEAMARKASLLARDLYYDEGTSKLSLKKNVYWLKSKTNTGLIKVRVFNPEKEK